MASSWNDTSEVVDGSVDVRTQQTRTLTLKDPDNTLDVATLSETQSINGRKYTTIWDGAIRSWEQRSPEGRTTRTELDELGRVVSEEIGGLAPFHYVYDAQGRISQVEQLGATTRFTYGQDGTLASVTDALGHTQRYEHDANGRTTAVVQADGSRIEGEYSGSDAVRAITVPNGARHNFGIGAAGLIQSYTPPANEAFSYSFNPFLELESVKLPTNDQLHIAYERGTGRPLSVSHAADNVTFGYDGKNPLLQSLTSAETCLTVYLRRLDAYGCIVARSGHG